MTRRANTPATPTTWVDEEGKEHELPEALRSLAADFVATAVTTLAHEVETEVGYDALGRMLIDAYLLNNKEDGTPDYTGRTKASQDAKSALLNLAYVAASVDIDRWAIVSGKGKAEHKLEKNTLYYAERHRKAAYVANNGDIMAQEGSVFIAERQGGHLAGPIAEAFEKDTGMKAAGRKERAAAAKAERDALIAADATHGISVTRASLSKAPAKGLTDLAALLASMDTKSVKVLEGDDHKVAVAAVKTIAKHAVVLAKALGVEVAPAAPARSTRRAS